MLTGNKSFKNLVLLIVALEGDPLTWNTHWASLCHILCKPYAVNISPYKDNLCSANNASSSADEWAGEVG